MALLMTFPCGRCGKVYMAYYPKVFIASVYGTMTPGQAEREDQEEVESGAIEASRRRAEGQGKIWVDVSQQSKITCTCGKNLNLNLADHPRVPQRKAATAARQTGMIAFPDMPKKHHGKGAPPSGGVSRPAGEEGAPERRDG